jgi:hypothetical protein
LITGAPTLFPVAVRVRSWIDAPAETPAIGPVLRVRGWCFDEGGAKLLGVRARVQGRLTRGIHGWKRLDVQAAFQGPASSVESGFGIAISLKPGAAEVRLEAEFEGAGWIEFHRLPAVTSWVRFGQQRLRLGRFRLGALLGWPAAADGLPPAEREWILARIEQEGGHPLKLSPHYPPRPLEPERFPASSAPRGRGPKFTIVTPSYQHGAFIEATLQSVLGQAGVDLDYIVQDGGSTDQTVAVLRRYAPRLKHWASEVDGGQADAIRRGFAHMEAGPDDVMAYLNSDDRLMPGALRFVAGYFARHPAVDAIYGHRVLIDEADQEVGRWFSPRRTCDDLRLQDLVPQETLFWRRRVWDQVGGVDPAFQFALDWDLILRFEAAGARIVRLPWFLGLFRLHPRQKSHVHLEQVGIPEMDRLRVRTLGRQPTPAELGASMQRAQIDSTVVRACRRHGWRL